MESESTYPKEDNEMKKFIVLLLAALMIFSLCVSCSEPDPKKAEPSEEIVNNVVNYTMGCFSMCVESVDELAFKVKSPTVVASELKAALEEELTTATVEVSATYTTLKIDLSEDLDRASIKISGISGKQEGHRVSGKFSISMSERNEGATLSCEAKGSFDVGQETRTISYSSVVFLGVDYDVAPFNEKINEIINNVN
jgi:hypothetical protein